MFGEFLVMNGAITRNQLDEALFRQKETGTLLGETLVIIGYLEHHHLDMYLEQHLLNRAEDIINDPELTL